MRARLVLRKPRQVVYEMVRQYVGPLWSEEGTRKDVPINLISLYVQIVGRKLIADDPRVSLSSFDRSIKPVVEAEDQWVNEEIARIRLAEVLEGGVVDGLFSIGIAKVALATPADSATEAFNVPGGEPFVRLVAFDDFVFDVHARSFSEVSFIGHRFRAPLAAILNSQFYRQPEEGLSGTEDKIYNLEGDERISLLGRTTLAGEEEFEDMVDLWELYLPRHKLVVTLRDDDLQGIGTSADGGSTHGRALRIQKWLGPNCGPYHILGFGRVPGNPMPKAPIPDLVSLHQAINNIVRKLIEQAHRQKEVLPITGAASEDGSRIINANDGEAIKCDHSADLKALSFGGPNQANFQLMTAFKDLFSWLAGNLDIMGGLSPQSKTAHQDAMLNENSSAGIAKMQAQTVTWTKSICTALCWYWHHHPSKVMRTSYPVPGMPEMTIKRNIFPDNPQVHGRIPGRMVRGHDFDDMKIMVDPYSMQVQTPQAKLQAIMQFLQTVYMPMANLAQQQGVMLDLNSLFEKAGKYMSLPDLEDILTMQDAPPPDQEQGQQPGVPSGGMPPNTTRTYERRSIGNSPAGSAQAIQQQLARGNPGSNGVLQNAGAA